MASYIGRRKFLATLIGGAAAAWPMAAHAQQPTMPVIGFLQAGSPGSTALLVAVFRQGLAEVGYVDARVIEDNRRTRTASWSNKGSREGGR